MSNIRPDEITSVLKREIESFDIDLAVEGDAIEFARRLGGQVTAHGRFGTAVVRFPDGRQLDVVTCRRETYAAPAALPDVEPGTIASESDVSVFI